MLSYVKGVQLEGGITVEKAKTNLLAEKQPVTPQMAMRIGKLLGNGPALWLNMQTAYLRGIRFRLPLAPRGAG